MAKKKIKNEIIDSEPIDNEVDIILDEDIEDIEDILIEDDIDDENNLSYSNFDIFYKFNTNKHKQEGKHALDRDTIFNGKIIKKDEDTDYTNQDEISKFNVKYETGSSYDFESRYHEDYLNLKNLSTDVYEILDEKTDIDFSENRRKPNREKFNNYFNLLYKELGFKYHKYEIFVELSLYFTDNIFNTFKLLDRDTISSIIKEMMRRGYFQNLENIKFL